MLNTRCLAANKIKSISSSLESPLILGYSLYIKAVSRGKARASQRYEMKSSLVKNE